MRLSDKRRGVPGQWTTIIVLVLLLAFLVMVAPASCAKPRPCKDVCLQRLETTAPFEQCQVKRVCTYWDNGCRITLWRERCRDCVTIKTWQDCYHQTRCTVNGLCERDPNPYKTKLIRTRTTCGSWGPWDYWTTSSCG